MADDGAADSVTTVLGDDHRRLDGILADVKRSLAAGEGAAALARFSEFRAGLDRHIDAEEEVLFPAFAELTGVAEGGPVAVMQMEHEEIRKRMGEVASRLEAVTGQGPTTQLAELTALLYAHNGKEERILYPTTDRLAKDDGRLEDLVRRLRAL